MDLNYHYYVTYAAACQAGFPAGDALTIARAARYVDECDGVTTNTTGKVIWYNFVDSLIWDDTELEKLAGIWPVFHFLPGGYRMFGHDMNPSLPEPQNGLICGTESALTETIVKGARECFLAAQGAQDRQGLEKALLRIGITMHVLADTFAHQGFAGIPSPKINEVDEVMHTADDPFLKPRKTFTRVEFALLDRSRAPTSESFGYLGHGRIGVCLDHACETLRYKAAWRNPAADPYATRCNPLEFYCAYLQMRDAMKFIKDPQAVGFQNKLDRAALVDKLGKPWNDAREIIGLFREADSDKKLKNLWHAHVEDDLWPEEYRSLGGDKELKNLFIKAAGDHAQLVKGSCRALREYIRWLLTMKKDGAAEKVSQSG